MNIKEITQQFFDIIGEDKNREGLFKTPERVEKAIKELFAGYQNCIMKTSAIRGVFKEDQKARQEFLNLIK